MLKMRIQRARKFCTSINRGVLAENWSGYGDPCDLFNVRYYKPCTQLYVRGIIKTSLLIAMIIILSVYGLRFHRDKDHSKHNDFLFPVILILFLGTFFMVRSPTTNLIRQNDAYFCLSVDCLPSIYRWKSLSPYDPSTFRRSADTNLHDAFLISIFGKASIHRVHSCADRGHCMGSNSR